MSANPKPDASPVAAAFLVESGCDRNGKPLPVVGDEITIKISSADTNGAFTVFVDTTPPLGGPPLHAHHVQDEWWYILEGEFLFEVDGEQFYAGPGDTVFAPHGSRHAYMNNGQSTARSLVTVVPGGLDLFFEELSALAPTAAAVAANPALIGEIFRKHGIELLGPPLNARQQKELQKRNAGVSSHPEVQNTVPTQAFVVPAGSGKVIPVIGDQAIIKIATVQTNGAFTVFEGVIAPQAGPPLHRHRRQDEWWYILEGEILFEVDGKVFHARPGDTAFAAHGTCHAFMNEGTTYARALVSLVPGGLDVFFEELSVLAPSGVPPDQTALAALFEKYDMELLGPPLCARYGRAAK